MSSRLLVLSNGHGEDLIALRLLEALRQRRPELRPAVLPLVGEGRIFAQAERLGRLVRLGRGRELPSGGFSNQSFRALLQDLAAGLPGLSWQQWRLVRRWGQQGDPVLAVGDLLPLILAWGGGGPFGFIGTPKSDYTWASPPPRGWGASPLADSYHRCKGSEWDPWEWALMASRRCRLVAVRDALTARGLQRHGVAALAPGNPMMDGFRPEPLPPSLQGRRRLLLLPGSRRLEALRNAANLLSALGLARLDPATTVLLACGGQPGRTAVEELLRHQGFQPEPDQPSAACATGAQSRWRRQGLELLVGEGCFQRWAPWSELALATAGTATEQVVGLGIPALSLPGRGPQFTPAFARRQSRLLGGAVEPCRSAVALAQRLEQWLQQPQLWASLQRRGQQRMGPPGGSERLAGLIERCLLAPSSAPRGG